MTTQRLGTQRTTGAKDNTMAALGSARGRRLERRAVRAVVASVIAGAIAMGGAASALASPGVVGQAVALAAAPADETQVSVADGIVWYLPARVEVGQDITIRGTGWVTADGSAGSGISVLINAPQGAEPTNGATVSTTREVVSEVSGTVLGDKRLHAQVAAAADGSWSATIPYPTPENSTLAAPWQAGETHGIRLLTGSAVDEDVTRSSFGTFTLVAPEAEEEPEPIEHVGVEHTTADGATYYVPESVAPEGPIRISGSGWTHPDGDAGSVIAVRLSGASGFVSTKAEVVNPANGAVQANKTIYAVAQADADGEWEIEVPVPTTENASEAWEPGDERAVTLLTGSLLAGDAQRSATANLTVAGGAEPGPIEHVGKEYVSPNDPAVRYYVPEQLEPGQDIVVSGTGWTNTAGAEGSVVGVLLDATASGDPNTVLTTRDVVNPLTGTVSTDKRLHVIVRADSAGSWTATIPYPTAENAALSGGGAWTDWAAGSTHQVRLLTGSLGVEISDAMRSLAADVTIAGDPPAGPTDPPTWAHETVTSTASGRTATAWVQSDVAAGDGSTLRIKGAGWVDTAGTGASTIAIKLNSGDGRQYTRSGSDIVEHPSASGDDTIWTLLAPANPDSHPNVVVIGVDGSFEIELDLPDGLEAGQYLSVLFQSGRFDPADVQRSETTGYLTVGGVPYEDDGDDVEATCRPSTSSPGVTIINPSVALGGVLTVQGTGWCHPGENRGGSVIALKIDEGAYSHLTDAVHQNRTIWAVVEADSETGDWSIDIQLPDGTAATSSPAFPEGAHTLRLLTGSLKTGDQGRSALTTEFVVGAYQPNGAPDPVDASTLTAANAGGVTVSRTADSLAVTIPGARAGDWIFITPFAADGSPRYPWLGSWFRADASGTVRAPLAGVTLPAGLITVAVQSGNQGELGRLVGWGRLLVAAPSPGTTPTPSPGAGQAAAATPVVARDDAGESGTGSTATGTGATGASGRHGTTALAARTPAQLGAPTTVPAPPAASGEGLTAANAGTVTSVLEGAILTITIPSAEPGDWVYLYAYSTPVPVGWIQVDADRRVRVDLAALEPGEHKLAVLDRDGALIGWTGTELPGEEAESAVAEDTESAAPVPPAAAEAVSSPQPVSAASGLSAADWWLIAGASALAALLLATAFVLHRRRPAAARIAR